VSVVSRALRPSDPATSAGDLLGAVGCPGDSIENQLTITGRDPILPTRFRVGEAAGAALAAQA
jgi:hypothetical protein